MTVAELASRCGTARSKIRHAELGVFHPPLVHVMACALSVEGHEIVAGIDAWNGIRDMYANR